jgi:hypothetical protein
MTYTLDQLSALEDIRTLKHRYFRGIDTADMALLADLFTEDVAVDYRGGTYRVQLSGREAMLDFLANAFHSGAVAMHHGHMPEITLDSAYEASGLWYLEDIFINLEAKTHTIGSAIYRDHYVRADGRWRIARTEYDRVFELVGQLDPTAQLTCHYLGRVGRPPEHRTDISHLISWEPA